MYRKQAAVQSDICFFTAVTKENIQIKKENPMRHVMSPLDFSVEELDQ